jgi:glycosyltransferase involved in cell wall biosynthesis
LAQGCNDIEIVVVDDGSTDETAEVMARYSRECGDSLQYIRQENRGESAARNVGILAAQSDVIALLDSDNIWSADKLMAQLPLFADPAVSFVFSGYETFGTPQPEVVLLENWVDTAECALEALLQGCCINTSTVVARRERLIDCGLFDESLICCQDHDLWLRLAVSGASMTYVPKILLFYRVDGLGVSSDERLVAMSTERIFERLFGSGVLPEKFQKDRRKYLSRCYLNSAVRQFRASEDAEALTALRKAARQRPASIRAGWLLLAATAGWRYLSRRRGRRNE